MIKSVENLRELIKDKLGFLFDEELIEELVRVGKIKDVKQDDIIVDVGQEISFIPFVLEGSIKVSRESESGEELLLYYIESGDTCAMTLQCCVGNKKSEIRATAIENTKLLTIPIEYMQKWMASNNSWREYILTSYYVRMQELLEAIDAIAFMKLDERLEKYLKDQAMLLGSLEINLTHQQIAEDLHSSRVVISRLLKKMESKGLLKIQRNKIVLDSI